MPTVLSPDAVPGPESAGNGPEGPGQSTDPRRGHPTGDLAERDPSTTRTGSRVAEHDLVAALQGDPLLVADRDRKSGVEGKSVSVRVDLGGRRLIQKKHET